MRKPFLRIVWETSAGGEKVYWLQAAGRRVCSLPDDRATFCWVDNRLVMAHPDLPASWVNLVDGSITPVPFADPPGKVRGTRVWLNEAAEISPDIWDKIAKQIGTAPGSINVFDSDGNPTTLPAPESEAGE